MTSTEINNTAFETKWLMPQQNYPILITKGLIRLSGSVVEHDAPTI